MGYFPIVLFLLVGGTPSPTADDPGIAAPGNASIAQVPLNATGRLEWAVKRTIGPTSLLVGVFDAGWGVYTDNPKAYGRRIEGYGKRYGLRLSSVATSNLMEAGLGAIWHEDPRYHPAHAVTTPGRVNHALKMAFLAENGDGSWRPAYARYIAFAGSNAISDAWRPDSQRTVGNTMERVGYSFAGRMLGNLFKEFWPDIKDQMFWNKH